MSNQGANVPGQTTVGGAIVGGTSPAILFINPNGILAQDPSNFGWDSTNKILLIEGQNALYRVPNASGDNWFDAGAGNLTLTGHSNFGTGSGALSALTLGNNNTAVGTGALAVNTTGNNNFAFGTDALASNISGVNNTAIGFQALFNLNQDNNFGLGLQAGFNLTSGQANCYIGTQAGLHGLNAARCVAIGRQAGAASTTGQDNVCIGDSTAASWGTGNNNVVIGSAAGLNVTGGSNNLLLGLWEGPVASISNVLALSCTDGSTPVQPQFDWNYLTSNVWSQKSKTTAQGVHVYNTFDDAVPTVNYERGVFDWNITSNVLTIGTPLSSAGGTGTLRDTRYYSAGFLALYRIPPGGTGGSNWFVGNAGNTTTTGDGNLAMGTTALGSVTTGINNVAIGSSSLANLTTGQSNFGLGTLAGSSLTTGNNNVAIGTSALHNCVSDVGNVALGASALNVANIGSTNTFNTAVGFEAGQFITTGQRNILIGALAGSAGSGLTSGSNNIGIGVFAAGAIGSGSLNTMIGPDAGVLVASGSSNNTLIGAWEGPNAAVVSNVIAITDGNAFNHTGQEIYGVDYNATASNVWSFQYQTTATGLHVYKTTDALGGAPTNYERGVFDWNASANVLTIGTQAGGTGTVRDFAITKGGNTYLTSATTTVASLPAAGVKGRHHFVTDANATTFQSIVAGGGTNNVPVFDDGTNWRIG